MNKIFHLVGDKWRGCSKVEKFLVVFCEVNSIGLLIEGKLLGSLFWGAMGKLALFARPATREQMVVVPSDELVQKILAELKAMENRRQVT